MDQNRFDRLARATGTPGTRRAVLGVVAGGVMGITFTTDPSATSAHHKHRHHHHHHKRHHHHRGKQGPPPDQCAAVTPPFSDPVATCASDTECCDGASCCQFGSQNPSGCYDLSSNQSACGLTCDTAVNCINFNPVRQCVAGQCVET